VVAALHRSDSKSMTHAGPERRRAPRFVVDATGSSRVLLRMSQAVQVLEMSPAGVLLASKTPMSIGEQAELCVSVKRREIRASVEVRHVSMERARGGPRYRAGAVFVRLMPEQRALLEELFGGESKP
jgi:hypothetical protein